MNCLELKEFIKKANKENLSPIEKDVYLYYYSCTRNDKNKWFCPDAEVAKNTGRSRSGVCDARKKLLKRKWISESSTFQIKTLVNFSVSNETLEPAPVSFETQIEDSQSETRLTSLKSDSPVSNQTENGEISVSNETPYKDKLNLEVEVEIKKEEEEHEQDACVRESQKFQNFAKTCLAGLRKLQNLNIISDETGWQTELERVFINKFTPEQVLETYQLTRKQHWRRGRITPKIVADNIAELEQLRLEIAEQEKEDAKTTTGKNGKGNNSDQPDHPRTTNETLAWLGINN